MIQTPNSEQLIIIFLIILVTLLLKNFYSWKKEKKNYFQFSSESKILETLIASTPIPLITFDEENNFLKTNQEGKQLIEDLGKSNWSTLRRFIVEILDSNEEELTNTAEIAKRRFLLNIRKINKNAKLIWIQDITQIFTREKREKGIQDLFEKSLEIAKLGTYSYNLFNKQDIEMESLSKITLEILGIKNLDDKVEFSIKKIFDNSNLKAFKELILQHLNSDIYFNHEFKIKNLNSEEKWIKVIGKVKENKNGSINVKGIIQDLTIEKKLLESLKLTVDREREINKMKSNFVSMTSHEFRTPLSIATSSLELMLNYLRQIENENIKVNLKNQIQRIERQINRIIYLLEDVLVLEKTSFADRELNLETIDLNVFFTNLIHESQSFLEAGRSIQLKTSGIERAIQSDRTLFFHLFHNLLNNAIKFSKKDIYVKLNFAQDISVEIQDFGIGIPDSEKEKVFDFFYRGSNTKNIKGTGLGLVIVKEIASKLSYELRFESIENGGTTFTIRIDG